MQKKCEIGGFKAPPKTTTFWRHPQQENLWNDSECCYPNNPNSTDRAMIMEQAASLQEYYAVSKETNSFSVD